MSALLDAETLAGHPAVSPSRLLDVSLVSMPFGQLPMPSIALAILKSTLSARGLHARTTHFTLDFAERIGVQLYSMIAVGFPGNQALAADWVFSYLLPGDFEDDPDEYLRRIIDNEDPDSLIGPVDPVSFIEGFRDGLLYAREHSRLFIQECAEKLVADGAPIIGFTSTFQQNAASIAVAQEIKRLAPDTMIVMGGANCEGEMGAQLIKTYDCLDAVISGEADWIFPDFVQCVKRGESPAGIAGVHLRGAASPAPSKVSFLKDMDSLPDCDFDDYFRQLAESDLADKVAPMVLYETARGCWWGEKAHCTFCGLNGQTMQYRRKSPARALSELASLTTRYPGRAICVVDNILDMSYFKTFIPALKEASLDADLFWEVKSNLKKSHVRQLKEANIRRIQPGVESFSSQVLTLMKKGVSGIQNIQLLKWCREIGIEPIWNILWGFPGEDPEEYRKMAAYMPMLFHLTPPITGKQIRLDRFSPNFTSSAALGFSRVRPSPAYKYVFRQNDEVTRNLAYYFAYDYADGRDIETYVAGVRLAIDDWIERHTDEEFYFTDCDDVVEVADYRAIARAQHHALAGLEREIFLLCDQAHSGPQILKAFGDRGSEQEVAGALRRMVDDRLILELDGSYLALALSTASYTPKQRHTA